MHSTKQGWSLAGLAFALEIVTRKHHYASNTYAKWIDNDPVMLNAHPFRDFDRRNYDRDFVMWVGSPGISASIGAFVIHVLGALPDTIKLVTRDNENDNLKVTKFSGLRFWKIRQHTDERGHKGRNNQHFVVAEAKVGRDVFMCGGMTDYSGEGGRAFRNMQYFQYWLSDATSAPLLNPRYLPFKAQSIIDNEVERQIDAQQRFAI